PSLGLRTVTMVYGAVVIVLALLAAIPGTAVRRPAHMPLTAVASSEGLAAVAPSRPVAADVAGGREPCRQ
ncbi:hypothetical protein ACFV5K_30020, partial [Streptomyces sp. NPDC059744]